MIESEYKKIIKDLTKEIESLKKEVTLLNNNFVFCKKHAEKAGTDANEYKKQLIKLEQENNKLLAKIEVLNVKYKSR